MIEVEVKACAPPKAKDRILALGATYSGEERHLDLYLNSPHRNMAERDEALRIRIKETGAFLTYKGPKLDSHTKSRREITVKVDDPKALEDIFGFLGFTRDAVVKKHRTKYRLGDITFALDEVEGLGSFVEVEASGGDDWEIRRQEVLNLLKSLGVQNTITKSYLELLAHQPL
jgi:adenylate cyclase class 2